MCKEKLVCLLCVYLCHLTKHSPFALRYHHQPSTKTHVFPPKRLVDEEIPGQIFRTRQKTQETSVVLTGRLGKNPDSLTRGTGELTR